MISTPPAGPNAVCVARLWCVTEHVSFLRPRQPEINLIITVAIIIISTGHFLLFLLQLQIGSFLGKCEISNLN